MITFHLRRFRLYDSAVSLYTTIPLMSTEHPPESFDIFPSPGYNQNNIVHKQRVRPAFTILSRLECRHVQISNEEFSQ